MRRRSSRELIESGVTPESRSRSSAMDLASAHSRRPRSLRSWSPSSPPAAWSRAKGSSTGRPSSSHPPWLGRRHPSEGPGGRSTGQGAPDVEPGFPLTEAQNATPKPSGASPRRSWRPWPSRRARPGQPGPAAGPGLTGLPGRLFPRRAGGSPGGGRLGREPVPPAGSRGPGVHGRRDGAGHAGPGRLPHPPERPPRGRGALGRGNRPGRGRGGVRPHRAGAWLGRGSHPAPGRTTATASD